MRYKLNTTLWYSDFYDDVIDYKDEEYKLFARKGQIFNIYILDEKLRDQFGINDKMWRYIAIAKDKGTHVLFQEDDNKLFEWFDIKET